MEALALLRQGPLFAEVPPAELGALAAQSEVRWVEKGNVLVHAESPQHSVVYLARGTVALYRRNPVEDVTLLLGILEAPALFGDAECAAGTPWMCSVRAEEDASCVLIPNDEFLRLARANRDLLLKLYLDACLRHLLANHTAQTLALYNVRTRLLRILLDYAHRFGRLEGTSAVIDRPLSLVDLANALGVNRKTVARTLKPLEQQGVVSRPADGASFVIHDLPALEKQLPRHLLGVSSALNESAQAVLGRLLGR